MLLRFQKRASDLLEGHFSNRSWTFQRPKKSNEVEFRSVSIQAPKLKLWEIILNFIDLYFSKG